jgi:hypothetical protein
MVPMYKWFPCTNGSHVQMVPMYKWFPCTNGSHLQMVPMYKWFLCLNGVQYQYPNTTQSWDVHSTSYQICCLVVNQELATLKPGYAPSTLQIKRSRSYQISGRVSIMRAARVFTQGRTFHRLQLLRLWIHLQFVIFLSQMSQTELFL